MTAFKENTKNNTTVKVLEHCLPTITISPDALVKMQLFVDNCSEEVGWLGTAYKDETSNNIHISDVFLFDQEVHSTTTEITPDGLATFAEEILQSADGVEIWNNLKVWGHSHVNMGVSPSAQDDSQMETFSEGGHDWFIRIIANKKGDLRVDLYSYTLGVIYNDLPWSETISLEEIEIENQINILYRYLEEIKNKRIKVYEDDIKEEIKEKVKKKNYIQTGSTMYWNKYKDKGTDTKNQAKNTTNESTKVTDGGIKKKESTKKEEEKRESDYKSELIETDVDVYHWFEYIDLVDIGECVTTDDVAEMMHQFGYYGIFDELELDIILRTAQKVAMYYYRVQ